MPELLPESRRIKIKPIRAQAAQGEGGIMPSTPRPRSQPHSQSRLQSQAQSRSQPQTQPQPQNQLQLQTQSQPQRNGTKRKRRDEHDAELLPLFLDVPPKEETVSTTPKVMLADRDPAVFRVFVQWVYFDTIPDRFGLTRLSTGKAVSNGFLLWSLGDFFLAGAFKNRIMSELYTFYSLSACFSLRDFVEFNAADIDYCCIQTTPNSRLRKFILDTFARHIVFGDYIRITRENDWYKLFTKYADLQVQIITTIAASSNSFSDEVTEAPQLRSYLEGTEAKNGTKTEETTGS